MIKIKKIGLSVPKNFYDQEEVYNILGYNNEKISSIFHNTGINKRHFVINKDQKLPITDNDAYYEIYTKNALELSIDCINKLNIKHNEIDQLIFVSSTGMLCPGLGFNLVKELGFRENIEVLNLVGHGCNGVFWAIENAINFLSRNKNKKSLIIAVETCSITCYIDDSIENAVANAIFSDGASCILLEESTHKNNNGVEIVDFINLIDPHSLDLLGFKNKYGALRVNLSKHVPEIINKHTKKMVQELLNRNNLNLDQITSWIIHPGGKKILEILEQEFNLNNKELNSAWNILKNFGNMSSPSILFVLNEELKKMNSGYGLMIGFGPGFGINAILTRK